VVWFESAFIHSHRTASVVTILLSAVLICSCQASARS
jgi:hypothetical protein